MLLGIDHLVIAVRDPDAAAAELEVEAGIAWTGGGRHEHAGTFNRLAFLGDAYLELIGVLDPGRVRSSTAFPVGQAALALLDEGREGLATYALATDDIARDVEALRQAGSPIAKPVAGARVRADGATIRWIAAFGDLRPEEPPFLIEHELAGPEWGDEARVARAAFRHPVGGRLRLDGIELPVRDPRGTGARYTATVGVELRGGQATVGDHAIRLLPADGWSPAIQLAAEPAAPELDLDRFGVRWRRRASG